MTDKALAQEIVIMVRNDQIARKAKKPDWKGILQIDQHNLERMKQIVKEFSWPDSRLVGKKASNLSWLLIQHADSDVKFQKQCLKLMLDSGADKKNIAYLTDRILVNTSQKQLYGTQFKPSLEPFPIQDAANLDKRRKEVGLGSFASYFRKIKHNS